MPIGIDVYWDECHLPCVASEHPRAIYLTLTYSAFPQCQISRLSHPTELFGSVPLREPGAHVSLLVTILTGFVRQVRKRLHAIDEESPSSAALQAYAVRHLCGTIPAVEQACVMVVVGIDALESVHPSIHRWFHFHHDVGQNAFMSITPPPCGTPLHGVKPCSAAASAA